MKEFEQEGQVLNVRGKVYDVYVFAKWNDLWSFSIKLKLNHPFRDLLFYQSAHNIVLFLII